MIKKATKKYDVGIIVGRFQVDSLHEAHMQLIDFVIKEHSETIIIIGSSKLPNTRKNPLPFEARRQMISDIYPDVRIYNIQDQYDDFLWSVSLDSIITNSITLSQKPVLYGSRDSFIKSYQGKYDTIELETDVYVSGTEVRNNIAKNNMFTRECRAGIIWASFNRYPTSYQAVDNAIFNEDYTKLLLVRKPGESKYRFCGGFVDPKTSSLEANARREVGEELHIEITDPVYIGSCFIDDWRYKGEVDGVMTTLFQSKYMYGSITPDDDICEAKWFVIKDIKPENDIMPTHRTLWELTKKWLTKNI